MEIKIVKYGNLGQSGGRIVEIYKRKGNFRVAMLTCHSSNSLEAIKEAVQSLDGIPLHSTAILYTIRPQLIPNAR
jgi:hypothetical protein